MSLLSVNSISPISGNSIGVSGSLNVTAGTITAPIFSGSFTGSFSGSIAGVATNALTASYITASNVVGTVSSASYATNALSASYAPSTSPFPYTGTATFSGSILVSGSIIPNVLSGSATSSFSLGSPTAAWKDIYVSNGTINFLNSAGQVQSTIGTGNNQLTGDTFIDGNLRQGDGVTASGLFSHAEGSYSKALAYSSHAEGSSNTGLYAWDTNSTVNGLIQLPTTVGNITSSFTNGTSILLDAAGTILIYTVSSSTFAASRTQIQLTDSVIDYGAGTPIALYSQLSDPSTQLANQTLTLGGNTAHSEGSSNVSLGSWSHTEGNLTLTLGAYSHTEGEGTIAKGDNQHVQGLYNITSSTAGAFILGNGTNSSTRSNLIFAAGNNVQISGSILVSGSIIPNIPSGSATSSFSLGSPTAAWKDIYVSNGTINFLSSTGQVQGTLGAGTNATVITGSLVTVPLFPLTYFANSSTLLHKSYTNSDCVFSLADSSDSYVTNPEIYTYGSNIVLPWDRKITAYSLVNNSYTAAPSSPSPVISLPPVYNAGYTTGDIITVYNMGEVEASYRASGSVYITATVSGVTAVDTSSKSITGTFNTSYILSGSWGNYAKISTALPATSHSIKIDPGKKATFEVVYWGNTNPGPSASVAAFPEVGYATNMTSTNPSYTYLVYLFKGITNL